MTASRLVLGVTLMLGLLAAPLAVEAQPAGKVHRIGFLGNSTPALEANLVGPFRDASLAVKKATTSVPLVMVAVGDPVATGLVASLAQPGGNVTGLTSIAEEPRADEVINQ